MDQIILQVMLAHNPWLLDKNKWPDTPKSHLPDRYIPRHLISPISCAKNKINLVIGPRQSGKSTLIWHFLETGSQPFLLVNCEEPSCRELCQSPAIFLKYIRELTSPLPGLFFEEVQHLPEAGLFLKGLVDLKPNVPIFVTGSASYHLKSKTRESLAGRAVRHHLFPFGMAELWPDQEPTLIAEVKAATNWKDLLIWGGYPEVVLNQNKQAVLAQLVEAFVLRDASDTYKIKRPDAFRKILSLAASQIGNLVNFSNWAETVGVSVNTVIEYVNLMAESHLVKLVPPFVGGKRAEVTSTPKIYFLDNGVRNLLFGGFAPETQRPDLGALTENLVFTELCKNTNPLLDTILYWRSSSGAEVDFVLRRSGKLIAVEVKAGALQRPKVSRSLRSFIQAYQPDQIFVFNESFTGSIEIEGAHVVFDKLIYLPSRINEQPQEPLP
jgi:uncharacterized protein